ncbi:hypothetical protein [Ornithinimicrobium sp. INDO-MA30-4]|uniref:hypothetical protein n=1 Tax=Ornithinimicrobium sp. INDO-MA30-4 TaxID=2908651 RepID=UPI001F45E030|nr:hypothetical protein [Ornithinimicrobium sp. INDO-MA30-4]UJH70863.1 hypothetical protein L0A91_02355 [Ornithinimicrobium sp. INDO-MA30-4]
MTAVHPISHAWISAGSTGAQNYDEFASDAEITDLIASAPYSALGVEMPHCAPESLGQAFADTLPAAAQRLAAAKADGATQPPMMSLVFTALVVVRTVIRSWACSPWWTLTRSQRRPMSRVSSFATKTFLSRKSASAWRFADHRSPAVAGLVAADGEGR